MINDKKMVRYVIIGGVVGSILGVLGLGLALILGPFGSIFVLPMIIVGMFTSEPLGNWTDLMRIFVNGLGYAIIFGVIYYISCLIKK